MQKITIFILAILMTTKIFGGVFDRIRQSIEKQDFEKAEKLIQKSLEKDQVNPGAKYFLSVMFLDEQFPRFNIDSAKMYIDESIVDFHNASQEILDELKADQLAHTQFDQQKTLVAKKAYQRMVNDGGLEATFTFLRGYSDSQLYRQAIARRDSLSFLETQQSNTWQSYKNYIDSYPESTYFSQAKTLYQQLVFKDLTRDDDLQSYIDFLKKYPNTPYRKEAEEIIFYRSTEKNNVGDYLVFLKNYPSSDLAKKAGDILYGLYLQNNNAEFNVAIQNHPNKDSLMMIHQLSGEWIPIMREGKIGFMDQSGTVKMEPQFEQCDRQYLCGHVNEGWLKVKNDGKWMMVNRTGVPLLQNVNRVKPVGKTLWIAETNNTLLYHMAGFKISNQSIDEAHELSRGWIAARHNFKWGIISPTGTQLVDFEYQSIAEKGAFIFLKQEDDIVITTMENLILKKASSQINVDDYEIVGDSLVQGFLEDKECLLNQKLEFLIPFDEHELYRSGRLWYVRKDSVVELYDDHFEQKHTFQNLLINSQWLATQSSGLWTVKSLLIDSLQVLGLDSVKLLSDQMVYFEKGGAAQIWFHNDTFIDVNQKNIQVMTGTAGSAFVMIELDKKCAFYDGNGQPLFQHSLAEFQLITDSLFTVKKNGKVGVIDALGKEVLPIKYEVIDEKDGLLFLLAQGKIGALDLKTGVLIPTEFEARIQRLGAHFLIRKDGRQGLLDSENHYLLGPGYDQIIQWTDTSFWARQGLVWQLIAADGAIVYDQFVSVQPWISRGNGELWYVVKDANGYGVMSNVKGELLPRQYTDILNLGMPERPILFAEQHLEPASFFVVTYFNENGEPMLSEAYRPADYERIYCDQ